LLKLAANIGTGVMTELSVYVRVAILNYAGGIAYRENKLQYQHDAGKFFDAFNTPFRANGMREPLSDSSRDSWVIAFDHFWDAGIWTAYPMDVYVDAVLALKKGGFTSRASKLGKLMKKHKTVAPTDAEWDAILNPPEKTVENPLKVAAEKWLKAADDETLKKPLKVDGKTVDNPLKPFATPTVENARQRKALRAVRKALSDLIAACDAPVSGGMSDAEEEAFLEKALTAGLATETPTGPTN
jgi:hypothetical protein